MAVSVRASTDGTETYFRTTPLPFRRRYYRNPTTSG
jgi:hypothetical protein